PLIEFYSKFGIVKELNGDRPQNELTILFREALYPVIYTIIGKKYSGKTELSKVLNHIQGITLLDFEEFKKLPEIKKLNGKSDQIVAKFIYKLRQMEDQRVLIENFPETKEQYNYFVSNCKPIERIYYLNADNASCLERLYKIPISAPNYVDCCQLNKLLLDFEKKADFIHFLKRQTLPLKLKDENGFFLEIKEPPKKKPKPVEEGGEEKPKVPKEEPLDLTNKKLVLMEVDVNNHKVLVIQKFIEMIQPFCLIVQAKEESVEAKTNLINTICTQYQFQILSAKNIAVEYGLARGIIKESTEDGINSDLAINLLRPFLFNETCNKFILEDFPIKLEDVHSFENNLCYINKYIYINDDPIISESPEQMDVQIYFQSKNKLSILPSTELKEFQIKECLNMTKDINIVYGMPYSGKTTMARHLAGKHHFTLLDFNKLIKMVKKSKVPPDEPDTDPESIEITFDDLIEGLKKYIETETKGKRIIVDNFFNPKGTMIETPEKAKKILSTIGQFRCLYEVTNEEETTLNKYKAKEGITEEITDEQKEAFTQFLSVPKDLLEMIKGLSCNIIPIKADGKPPVTKKEFDSKNSTNFIIIKHRYDINIEKIMERFAFSHKMLYINVPKLIYTHFLKNDPFSKKLESKYGKKQLKNEIKDKENDFDGFIYYKYNPIHFDRTMVNEMILAHCRERYQQIESSGNYVILTGYLNYDLLDEPDHPFNLPLYEIKNVVELGDLSSFITITKEDIKQEED
ncbi:MAG: ATP-binding protein, partial [archaeon]|nr:ATP-binding protein [archaeon]